MEEQRKIFTKKINFINKRCLNLISINFKGAKFSLAKARIGGLGNEEV
jgi:hypothetical protein